MQVRYGDACLGDACLYSQLGRQRQGDYLKSEVSLKTLSHTHPKPKKTVSQIIQQNTSLHSGSIQAHFVRGALSTGKGVGENGKRVESFAQIGGSL